MTSLVPDRIRYCARRLKNHYGLSRHGNKRVAIDELIYILLSRQTSERNFKAAYRKLRSQYRTWDGLLKAPERDIFEAVRGAGFGRQRTTEIKAIAARLSEDFGKVTLAPLSRYSTRRAESYLTVLRGVGKKTARCVLMYALNRQVFPVDVHCFRVLNRLGLISLRGAVRNHEDRIQEIIPRGLRYTLHVTLVSLGRDVCHSTSPECARCPVLNICSHGKRRRSQQIRMRGAKI
jgi:endonuclease III